MDTDLPYGALTRIADLLNGSDARWVVGGSTGLVLRGALLERAPRDIDIYADQTDAKLIHERLHAFALDGPKEDETERYYSVLSHYRIDEALIELVGNFRVTALESIYTTEVADVLFPNCDWANIDGRAIPLVPLGHELIFNLLRERMDRSIIAGRLISRQPERHVAHLRELLRRNPIDRDVASEAIRMAASVEEEKST